MQPPIDQEPQASVQSDLTFSNLPVITVHAQDFGKDVEAQQHNGMVEAAKVLGKDGKDVESQQPYGVVADSSKPTSTPKSNIIKIAGVAFLVAAIVGITVSVVVGTKGSDRPDKEPTGPPWEQPDAPRRSITFVPSFASCESLRTAFGELPENAMNAMGQDPRVEDPIFVEPAFNWWPNYPQDYCDFCNCSDSWTPPFYYATDAEVAEAADGGSQAKSSADDYTGTNNQVEDVDESDIIKTDGKYVYILPRGEQVLVIATAYPFDAVSLVSSTNLTRFNMEPSEMLLDGDSLVIIGAARVKNTSAGIGSVSLVSVQLWDISDRTDPSLIQTQEVEGTFNTARLINGFVYVIIQTWPYSHFWYSPWAGVPEMANARVATSDMATSEPYYQHQNVMSRMAPLARFLVGDEADIEIKSMVPLTPITECSKISSVEGLGVADSWLTILSVATQGTSSVSVGAVQSMTHAGRGGNVFVSTDNVYVAATNYDYFLPATNTQTTGQLPRDGVWTGVLKFGMVEGKASFKQLIEVPGSVLNQFSMDEHEGHFRIATTYGDMWGAGDSVSNVFIFDAGGVQTGEVTGLAPGERIFAARFQGDKAYIVTFRQVDPLFVLDLSDPVSPIVLGELKIPGWSDYLHPVNATHLIGLGKAASADGVAEGVKVALFDVSDPTAPKEQYSLSLGDRGSDSEARWDHKAFLFHAPTGLLVFPLTLREIPDKENKSDEELRWAWGEVVVDGAAVLYLGEEGFEQRGYVSHMSEPPSDDNWWGHSVRKIYRAGFMSGGDEQQQVLFSYSQRELHVHDLSNLAAPISQLQLSSPQCLAASAD